MLESGRETMIIRHRPAERSIHLEPRSILAEDVDLRMANSNSSEQPGWQRNPIFEFFASLKLAVVLLAVLIIAAMAGTIYESSFDSKVARAYVYGAPWFNLWLVLLGANLAASAFSRWPWRKHHLAFLITHLGIITLLIGSLIGRIFGIEGTMTLFKGEGPTNRLLINQRQLRVHDVDGIVKGFAAEFLHHPPNRQHPRNLGLLASGARLQIVDYASAIEGKLNPKPVADGGAPALHFTMSTAMMNQHLDSWLLADDPQHGNFSLGLANVELKRGAAPNATEGRGDSPNRPEPDQSTNRSEAKEEVDLEESIFAFSKAPGEQIGRVRKGGSTGAKVSLEQPQNGNKGRVLISLGEREASFDVGENLGREVTIDGTPFVLKIDGYWSDFRIADGKPSSLSDQPNNPAVLVTIRGKAIPVAEAATNPHGGGKQLTATGGPPTMPATGEEAPNRLTLFVADDGAITYELVSRKNGKSAGNIEINKPLATAWADWQISVDKMMPHAEQRINFTPVKSDQASTSSADLADGVRVRIQQNGETLEQWVPAGWQVTVPTSPSETMIAYGWKTAPLPIGVELLEFEVKRNEGSNSPAGFKSNLRIVTADGDIATGSCWMNNPFSYPGAWWRTWTGLTYKISQASWNPENLGQSTVQILRDPGWLLKWIGSLLVVIGVFMMFYLQPYRKQTEGEPITPSGPKPKKRQRETSSAIPATVQH